ncbi:c-type cytochrome [Jhaorihella thermophila]|uniref:Cytochrome c n=1 Tax=Jhaorihella thermophila TaxID=488547 RepID=A0A1H5WXY5_9RHOB|nr:c-type cytochrome [Jhaorihella thermophila]SEG04020.1 cytochrome c [Jhaorihella thermophila]
MKRMTAALCLALTLPALPAAASEKTFQKIKIEAGEKLFEAECRRCHAPDSTHASYGPPLENVIGRAAGSYPGYDYSAALASSGIVWTPAALRAWMEDNTGFMPGTRMRHVGIKDRTVQDFILAYLQSITTQDR